MSVSNIPIQVPATGSPSVEGEGGDGGSPSAEPAIANRLTVLVKRVVNLPTAFQSYAIDSKGLPSTVPDEHVFTYTLSCGLAKPPEPALLPSASTAALPAASPQAEKAAGLNASSRSQAGQLTHRSESPPKTPSQQPPGPKLWHDFVGGRFKQWDGPADAHRLQKALDRVAEAEELAKEAITNAAIPPASFAGSSSFNQADALTNAYADDTSAQPCVAWLWHNWGEKEEDLSAKPEGGGKTPVAGGGKTPSKAGKKTPAQEEDEERKRKEAEERQRQREEAFESGQLAPHNMCQLDIPPQLWNEIKDKADANIPLTFLFRRVVRPQYPADWVDVNDVRYRAEVPIDLSVFLQPGRTMHEYTIPLAPYPPPPQDPDEGKDKKKAAKKPAAGKKKGGEQPATIAIEEDPYATPVHPYTEAGTKIVLILRWEKPLMHLPEHRPRPEFTAQDIIPRRVQPQKKPLDGARAYSNEIRSVVLSLVDEWRRASSENAKLPEEKVKEQFLAALANTGLRNSYKEKLKACVIKIVRERFSKKNGGLASSKDADMQTFYNELYVYLVDLMHQTINEMFARPALVPDRQTVEENRAHDRWRRLADEAEEVRDFTLAARYHQERLVQESEDNGVNTPEVWYEYGTFALRTRDAIRAEQAFKEALALTITHLPALIAYGLLLTTKKLYPEAEVFLQSAVDVEITGILPWGCLGLYIEVSLDEEQDEFRRKERSKEAAYSYSQAKRALLQQKADSSIPQTCSYESIYLFLAEFMLDLRFEDLAEHCLENERKRVGESMEYFMLLGRLYYQRDVYDRAEMAVKKVMETKKEDTEARLLLGDIYRDQNRAEEAEYLYDIAIGKDGHGIKGPIYVRLGTIQLQLAKYEDARDTFLWGAKVWPCGLTWLGVGMSYYRMGDYVHAEQALNESNILNNLNPMTWAYLCLLCLRTGCFDEADQSFAQAVRMSLRDPDIIAEIGIEQQLAGRMRLAEAAFRLSIQQRDCASTRLMLAKTLTEMRLFDEAQAEYSQIAANGDSSDAERSEANTQLAIIGRVRAE